MPWEAYWIKIQTTEFSDNKEYSNWLLQREVETVSEEQFIEGRWKK